MSATTVQQQPETLSNPSISSPKVETTNTTTSTTQGIAPEFLQAIDDAFQVIGQTYDLTDNKEVFDFVRQTLVERFTHVKPRQIKVQAGGKSGGKGRNKKVAYNLYISHRFAENKKNPSGKSTTDLMTQFSKEWKSLSDTDKQPFIVVASEQNAELFPEKVAKQKSPPRPMSGYNLFLRKHSADFKAQYPELKSAERMSKIGAAWKALSKQEQANYKEEATEIFHAEHPEIAATAAAKAATTITPKDQ